MPRPIKDFRKEEIKQIVNFIKDTQDEYFQGRLNVIIAETMNDVEDGKKRSQDVYIGVREIQQYILWLNNKLEKK